MGTQLKLLFATSFMILSNLGIGQTSGSGAISGYEIFCSNGQPDCQDQSNPDDSIMVKVTQEGAIQFTMEVTPGSVPCCGGSFSMLIFGELQAQPGDQIKGTVNVNFPSRTFTIDCVAPGDSFLLIFAGEKGDYNYSYQEMPANKANDPEPNNEKEDAKVVPENTVQEGHIGFGTNKRDLFDYFKIGASSDGEIKVVFSHDAGMNYAAINLSNNLIIHQKLKPNADTDTLSIPCVAAGDSFLIRVAARSNICASYGFFYNTESVQNLDNPDNLNYTNAQQVLNLPGQIAGSIGYGYYTNLDNADYYRLGTIEQGDMPSFSFEVGPNSLNADLIRVNTGFINVEYNFGNILPSLNQTVSISQSNVYYLRIKKHNACSEYTVDIGGSLSHILIDGVDGVLAKQANGSITVSNSIAGPNSTLCAPCVLLLPIFVVPLGNEFEINVDCPDP